MVRAFLDKNDDDQDDKNSNCIKFVCELSEMQVEDYLKDEDSYFSKELSKMKTMDLTSSDTAMLCAKSDEPLFPATESPFFWIDTVKDIQEKLSQMSEELRETPILGVDLEYFDTVNSM